MITWLSIYRSVLEPPRESLLLVGHKALWTCGWVQQSSTWHFRQLLFNIPSSSFIKFLVTAQAARKVIQSVLLIYWKQDKVFYLNQAAKMAVTIEELDATVKTFYEGRGEAVSIYYISKWSIYIKELIYWRVCAIAKSRTGCNESGTTSLCAENILSFYIAIDTDIKFSSRRIQMHGY